MPSAESVSDGLGRWSRLAVCLLGLAVVVHGVLLAMWLAPSSPVRDAVGAGFLSTYIDPYFKQGNDTLGIGANRIDESLQIRLWVQAKEEDAEPEAQDWVDVTAIETRALRGDFAAARSHHAARRLAASLNLAMLQFDDEQLELIAEFDQEGQPIDRQRALLGAGASPRIVQNFLGVDEMARRFASLWLGDAVEDGEIVRVEYRVGRREAPSAKQHGSQSLRGTPFEWFDMGTRKPYRGTPEARAAFEDYVEALRG